MRIVKLSPEESAEMRREMAGFKRDSETLFERRDELLDAHPNEWVSVHQDRIFHAGSLDELFGLLRDSGIDPARVPCEYLSRDLPPVLL